MAQLLFRFSSNFYFTPQLFQGLGKFSRALVYPPFQLIVSFLKFLFSSLALVRFNATTASSSLSCFRRFASPSMMRPVHTRKNPITP